MSQNLIILPILIIIQLLLVSPLANALGSRRVPTLQIDAIYQFGDSISDTGNLVRQLPFAAASAFGRLPYGQTFFHHPTGRCSDGLLIVDYFAKYFGLPLLNPYLAQGSDFRHGVNFAVAGATALDESTLRSKNVYLPLTHTSLDMQLSWFTSYLHSFSYSPLECRQKLQKALVIMGEIGGNDYNFAFFQGRAMKDAFALVPQVVETIKNAVKEVIEVGAVNVLVPGNFPIGCVPLYLVRFRTRDLSMYDDTKCLKEFNQFSMYHNQLLQQALGELQQQYPNVSIVYGDYYSALKWLILHASALGFERGGERKTCCAEGNNPYNFDLNRRCGNPGVPVCADPTKRVSWDGIHMTQQANKFVSTWLLQRFVPRLRPSFLIT